MKDGMTQESTILMVINQNDYWFGGMKLSPLQEILQISNKLPVPVLNHIKQRIGDWLASGGNEDDPYIEQQLRFARRFVDEDKGCDQ